MDDEELKVKMKCGRVVEEEEPGCEGEGVMRYRVVEERSSTRHDVDETLQKNEEASASDASRLAKLCFISIVAKSVSVHDLFFVCSPGTLEGFRLHGEQNCQRLRTAGFEKTKTFESNTDGEMRPGHYTFLLFVLRGMCVCVCVRACVSAWAPLQIKHIVLNFVVKHLVKATAIKQVLQHSQQTKVGQK
jgi:hypothetical protein